MIAQAKHTVNDIAQAALLQLGERLVKALGISGKLTLTRRGCEEQEVLPVLELVDTKIVHRLHITVNASSLQILR